MPSDRLYEYRIGADGRGERKANFLVQPRFEAMRHYESGDAISSPFDHVDVDEGINVRFSCSNLEPDDYRTLLTEFLQALAQESGTYVNTDYFAGAVHEMSNITTYERYVRLRRSMSPKVVDETRRGKPVVRIDTVLSQLKSTSTPRLQEVLDEALRAWRKDGRDVMELRNGPVRWEDGSGTRQEWRVSAALERADGPVETAADVRWIVVGMEDSEEFPATGEIKSALQLLAHPSIGVVEQDEEGYRITTDYENGVQLVQSLGDVVRAPGERES